MNSKEVSLMLASSKLNLNETVWFYRIKPAHRHVLLFILDDCCDELARKEFGANPSDWDMNALPKMSFNSSVAAGHLADMKVVKADQFLEVLKAHELIAEYLAR